MLHLARGDEEKRARESGRADDRRTGDKEGTWDRGVTSRSLHVLARLWHPSELPCGIAAPPSRSSISPTRLNRIPRLEISLLFQRLICYARQPRPRRAERHPSCSDSSACAVMISCAIETIPPVSRRSIR